MERINKGTIASISGYMARVLPHNSSKPTAMIMIPWHLRADGNLKKGTEVVYVEFDDSTGLLLGRSDGEGTYESGGSASPGNAIAEHNVDPDSHQDIRALIPTFLEVTQETYDRLKAAGELDDIFYVITEADNEKE